MKILVIDNVDDMRRIMRLALERMGGMTVLEAPGGLEGLELARQERPDAILLDVMMPGMDGRAVLLALRADPVTAVIPVIFITASVGPAELRELKLLGCQGVIAKPFDPMTLAGKVMTMLRKPAVAAPAP